jgi:hypothetical protein
MELTDDAASTSFDRTCSAATIPAMALSAPKLSGRVPGSSAIVTVSNASGLDRLGALERRAGVGAVHIGAQSLSVEDAPIPPFARLEAPPGFFTTIISRPVLSRDIAFPRKFAVKFCDMVTR